MKNISLLALFTIMISMVSCKKDEAERNTDRLNGKWTVESAIFTSYENGKEVDREERTDLNLDWEFRSDGTATVNLDGGDVEVNWTATESLLKLMTKNDDATGVDLQIKSLSKSNLHLEFNFPEDVEEGVTYKRTYEYKLRKI